MNNLAERFGNWCLKYPFIALPGAFVVGYFGSELVKWLW